LVEKVKRELRKYSHKDKALVLKRFFKTGPGEYAEGDIFIGVQVPSIRKVAQRFHGLALDKTLQLLRSPIHEERLLALLILIRKFTLADNDQKEKIYTAYLAHTKFINNWDLVDLSAPNIVGSFLMDKAKQPLYALVKSASIWERRIAILATFYFIRNKCFKDTFKIAALLLADEHDLIHKAAGWMLREVGKKDSKALESFLNKHYQAMPRTMLRYAIEKFPESKRKIFMK
jgi:3-methyladenine DNA glycosylase AlkD